MNPGTLSQIHHERNEAQRMMMMFERFTLQYGTVVMSCDGQDCDDGEE
jgi:hypothetical protein